VARVRSSQGASSVLYGSAMNAMLPDGRTDFGVAFGVTHIAVGIGTTVIASMVNTWVLRVEIPR
jgi:hypothetical protein